MSIELIHRKIEDIGYNKSVIRRSLLEFTGIIIADIILVVIIIISSIYIFNIISFLFILLFVSYLLIYLSTTGHSRFFYYSFFLFLFLYLIIIVTAYSGNYLSKWEVFIFLLTGLLMMAAFYYISKAIEFLYQRKKKLFETIKEKLKRNRHFINLVQDTIKHNKYNNPANSKLICQKCLLRFRRKIHFFLPFNIITYFCCPHCDELTTLVDIDTITMVIDRKLEVDNYWTENSSIFINWFKFQNTADFDSVIIKDAEDIDIEEFIMTYRNNSNNHTLRNSKKVEVTISKSCQLSENKLNLLSHTFKNRLITK